MALYLGSKKAVKGNYKGGVDASGVTTIPSDLKAGKYYVDSNGTLTAGTMPTVTHPTPSITVSSDGVITATSTLGTSGYIESGVKSATKPLTTKGATYYTPSTSNQTISSGQYLTGVQTIYGDENLVASNIKSGTSIFGVNGTYKGALHAVYLPNTPVTAFDYGCSFNITLGEANVGDILYFINIVKESGASTDETVALSVDAISKTSIGWCETSSGTGKLTADASDFSNGYFAASINVVPDSTSSTGYSAQLDFGFLPDYGGDVVDGDKFTLSAVWGSATY